MNTAVGGMRKNTDVDRVVHRHAARTPQPIEIGLNELRRIALHIIIISHNNAPRIFLEHVENRIVNLS